MYHDSSFIAYEMAERIREANLYRLAAQMRKAQRQRTHPAPASGLGRLLGTALATLADVVLPVRLAAYRG